MVQRDNLKTNELEGKISDVVQEWAHDLFCDLGIEDDFCIQSVGQTVVFGGRNRIVFSKKGFSLDRSYCDADVVAKFDQLFQVKNGCEIYE